MDLLGKTHDLEVEGNIIDNFTEACYLHTITVILVLFGNLCRAKGFIHGFNVQLSTSHCALTHPMQS